MLRAWIDLAVGWVILRAVRGRPGAAAERRFLASVRGTARVALAPHDVGHRVQHPRLLARTLGLIGSIAQTEGRLADADRNFDESMRIAGPGGFRAGPGPRRAVQRALEVAREHATLISLDMNYRSALWSPRQAACVLGPLAAHADVVFAGSEMS